MFDLYAAYHDRLPDEQETHDSVTEGGKTSLLPAKLFNAAVSARNHLPHLTPIRPPKPKIDLAAKVEELEKRLAALESWRKS